LSSRLAAEDVEYIGISRKSGEKEFDIIQQTREEYGRYFGICNSYHHLKACICKNCPSYSGGEGMFCSKGKSSGHGKKEGCLCETCELFRKFRIEGEYFCLKAEKPELLKEKEKPEFFLKNFRKTPEYREDIRFCVVEESKM